MRDRVPRCVPPARTIESEMTAEEQVGIQEMLRGSDYHVIDPTPGVSHSFMQSEDVFERTFQEPRRPDHVHGIQQSSHSTTHNIAPASYSHAIPSDVPNTAQSRQESSIVSGALQNRAGDLRNDQILQQHSGIPDQSSQLGVERAK